MLELLFLLLPVAAAYGWYMGRRSAQQNKQDEANRLSRDYVAGVNFLLSNQQDKAVDLFLDMLKEDTGTVEAHGTQQDTQAAIAWLQEHHVKVEVLGYV